MSDSRGWTKDPMELLRWQLLPWIAARPSDEPRVSPFLDGSDWSEDDLTAVVRSLNERGLTRRPDSLAAGRLDTRITPDGHAEVRSIMAARQDRARRGVAAQEALLDWVYDNEHRTEPIRQLNPDAFLGDLRAHFLGDPLTASEIERAAASLFQSGHIDGSPVAEIDAPLNLSLTESGRAIVERGGVLHTAHVVAGVQNIVNMSGGIASIGQGLTVHTSQNVYGVDPEQLAAALRAVADATSDLDSADRQEANRALITIEDEAAEGFPEPGVIRRRLATLRSIAARTAAGTEFVAAVAGLTDILARVIGG